MTVYLLFEAEGGYDSLEGVFPTLEMAQNGNGEAWEGGIWPIAGSEGQVGEWRREEDEFIYGGWLPRTQGRIEAWQVKEVRG